MERRKFLKDLAVVAAATRCLPDAVKSGEHSGEEPDLATAFEAGATSRAGLDIEGHTQISEFKTDVAIWKVYEDLRTREGAITFVSSNGRVRALGKSAEASFPEADPAYLGLNLKDIGTTGADLLAERLRASGGEPDPAKVMSAAPPLGSSSPERSGWRLPWDTIVGTKECFDTMPVFPAGGTRTYHPVQYFSELTNQAARKRFDGLIGGWMPAVRKVVALSETAYDEVVVFGDVQARDKFIVQTWHRTARVENGKITKVVYGHTYPGFAPRTILQLYGRQQLVAATPGQDRSDGGFAGGASRGKPAFAPGRSRLRIDPRLERIGFLPGPETHDLVASLLRQQRVFGEGAKGYRSSVERHWPIEARTRNGKDGHRLAEAQQGTARRACCEHGKERTKRYASSLHWAVPRNHHDVLGIDAERKAEPATVGAPRLCRVIAGRHAARQAGQHSDRLHARVRCHDARSRCQRRTAAS